MVLPVSIHSIDHLLHKLSHLQDHFLMQNFLWCLLLHRWRYLKIFYTRKPTVLCFYFSWSAGPSFSFLIQILFSMIQKDEWDLAVRFYYRVDWWRRPQAGQSSFGVGLQKAICTQVWCRAFLIEEFLNNRPLPYCKNRAGGGIILKFTGYSQQFTLNAVWSCLKVFCNRSK